MNTESLTYSPSQGEVKTGREGPPLLTESQSFAAQTAYSSLVFKNFFSRAHAEVSWLKQKDPFVTKEQYVFGMLDAYDVLTARDSVRYAVTDNKSSDTIAALQQDAAQKQQRLEANRGELGEYFLSQTEHVVKSIAQEGKELLEKAGEWSVAEQNATIESSQKSLLKLFGKDERAMLYERAGLTPERVTALKREKRKEIAKTVGANALSDGTPLVLGVAAERFVSLGETIPSQWQTPALLGILATEGALLHTLFWENGKENLKSLVDTGVSTVALSKVLYDKAKEYTTNEKWQKIAGTFGYAGHHVALESPYFFALMTVMTEDLKGGTMLLVSNAASYGINKAKLKGSQMHRRVVRKREESVLEQRVIDLTEYDEPVEPQVKKPSEVIPLEHGNVVSLFRREVYEPILFFRPPEIDGSTALDS